MDPSVLTALIAAGANLGKPRIEAALRRYEKMAGKPLKNAESLLGDDVYAWQTTNRVRYSADAWGVKPGSSA